MSASASVRVELGLRLAVVLVCALSVFGVIVLVQAEMLQRHIAYSLLISELKREPTQRIAFKKAHYWQIDASNDPVAIGFQRSSFPESTWPLIEKVRRDGRARLSTSWQQPWIRMAVFDRDYDRIQLAEVHREALPGASIFSRRLYLGIIAADAAIFSLLWLFCHSQTNCGSAGNVKSECKSMVCR